MLIPKGYHSSVTINPENAAYQAIAFSGPAPESDKERTWLELDELGLKLERSFSPHFPLLLGFLSTPSKPLLRARASLGVINVRVWSLNSQMWTGSETRIEKLSTSGRHSLRCVDTPMSKVDTLMMLGLIWIRGSTEPMLVQTPEVTMQLAYTTTVPTTLGYNQLVEHVGIHGQRRLTEALNKDSLVWQKEYPTE
ncbi:hypothetical protein Taro_004794, partial [Colocasia esculenta]|nr:hypothetical protein [Colocasia esculenta]